MTTVQFRPDPVICQIERAMHFIGRVESLGRINPYPFLQFDYKAEEAALHSLADQLLQSGFSHSQVASHIRDAVDRIHSIVWQRPIDQRGVSWFCKGGLYHRLMGTENHRNCPSEGDNQSRGEAR